MTKLQGFHSDYHFIPIQNKKIFCAYHANQFLTNFCKQNECLMPLCPSCISEHTQQHFINQKKPKYQNLNQALNNAKQQCYLNIVTLQNYRVQNQDIYEYISLLKENIHSQLQQSKMQIFKLLTHQFDQFQNILLNQICNSYQDKNVYDMEQCLNASSFIDQQINTLYSKISALKGDDCLSALITFHACDNKNYQETLSQFRQYLKKNKKQGKIQISLNNEILKEVTLKVCERLLRIQSLVKEEQELKVCSQIQQKPKKSLLQNFQKQNININGSAQKEKIISKRKKIEITSPEKKYQGKNYDSKSINESERINESKRISQNARINETISSRELINDKLDNKQSKRLIRTYKAK